MSARILERESEVRLMKVFTALDSDREATVCSSLCRFSDGTLSPTYVVECRINEAAALLYRFYECDYEFNPAGRSMAATLAEDCALRYIHGIEQANG